MISMIIDNTFNYLFFDRPRLLGLKLEKYYLLVSVIVIALRVKEHQQGTKKNQITDVFSTGINLLLEWKPMAY